jgi:hypothetical protein
MFMPRCYTLVARLNWLGQRHACKALEFPLEFETVLQSNHPLHYTILHPVSNARRKQSTLDCHGATVSRERASTAAQAQLYACNVCKCSQAL